MVLTLGKSESLADCGVADPSTGDDAGSLGEVIMTGTGKPLTLYEILGIVDFSG